MKHAINRFELKYVLDAFSVKAFLRDLKPFVSPDEHCDSCGFYRVTSLYYDTEDLACYRAKLDGVKFRRKLRLRVYPEAGRAVTLGHVEIKQRIDKTVQKRRILLPIGQAQALCERGVIPRELDPGCVSVAEEVRLLSQACRMRPTSVVSYVRRAFVGSKYEGGLRVTVDSDLSARVHALDPCIDASNHRFLPHGMCVLEVKVDERVPSWLASLLAAHDFALRRMSKYCLGLETAMRSVTRRASLRKTSHAGSRGP